MLHTGMNLRLISCWEFRTRTRILTILTCCLRIIYDYSELQKLKKWDSHNYLIFFSILRYRWVGWKGMGSVQQSLKHWSLSAVRRTVGGEIRNWFLSSVNPIDTLYIVRDPHPTAATGGGTGSLTPFTRPTQRAPVENTFRPIDLDVMRTFHGPS